MIERYSGLIELVREKKPLIHHITNYVTVNDCANITLGIGASPVMADASKEAADIAAIAQAVVLNMGTLNERTIPSMLLAGKSANALQIPVVFDPVGAGASMLRNETALQILSDIQLTVLRGNISEARFLAGLSSGTKGVDASDQDLSSIEDSRVLAKSLAKKLGCVVAITGAVDIVSDGDRVVSIGNGVPMLSCLTGTGCMCSSLIGSLCGAAPDVPMDAAVCALLIMGIAGEIAHEKAGVHGNGSFRVALHDAISLMDAEILIGRAKINEAWD